jgi:hypothetical protein
MSERLTLLTAAIFSAIATALAAIATWRAPIQATKLAEALRRDTERHTERHKRKYEILTALMQERARIENAVQALNLIDIVFNDSREVREAWAELLLAFDPKLSIPKYATDERLRKLLAAIAKDIGLTDELRNDDLGRVYYPNVQAQEQLIRDLQRQQTIVNLQVQDAARRSSAGLDNSAWPPKPT